MINNSSSSVLERLNDFTQKSKKQDLLECSSAFVPNSLKLNTHNRRNQQKTTYPKQLNYGYSVKDKKSDFFSFNSPIKKLTVKAKNVNDFADIKNYFLLSPYERVKAWKNYAHKIDSSDKVIEVLKLGNSGYEDAYHGAIALLAECQANLLIETVNKAKTSFIYGSELNQFTEEKLEILIQGIACSSELVSYQKLNLILSFFVKNLGRQVKTAIIDSLVILEEEIDADVIKTCLKRFASSREPDDYVRSYAKEAISDLG